MAIETGRAATAAWSAGSEFGVCEYKIYTQIREYRPNSDENYIVTNCCTTSVKDDMVAADLQEVDAQVPDAPLNNNHNKRE